MYENAPSDPFWDDFDIPNNAWTMGIPIYIYISVCVYVCVYSRYSSSNGLWWRLTSQIHYIYIYNIYIYVCVYSVCVWVATPQIVGLRGIPLDISPPLLWLKRKRRGSTTVLTDGAGTSKFLRLLSKGYLIFPKRVPIAQKYWPAFWGCSMHLV